MNMEGSSDFILDLPTSGNDDDFMIGNLDTNQPLLSTDFSSMPLDLMCPPPLVEVPGNGFMLNDLMMSETHGNNNKKFAHNDVFKLDDNTAMKMEPLPSGFNRPETSSIGSFDNDWSSSHSHSPSLTSESTPASPGNDFELPSLDLSLSMYSESTASRSPSSPEPRVKVGRKRKSSAQQKTAPPKKKEVKTDTSSTTSSNSKGSSKKASAKSTAHLTKSERNRLSAQRYREKKKNEVRTLRQENDRLTHQNQQLVNSNRELRMELKTLRSLLENKKVRMFSLLFVLVLCPILAKFALSPSSGSLNGASNDFIHSNSVRPGSRVLLFDTPSSTEDLGGMASFDIASSATIHETYGDSASDVNELDLEANYTDSEGMVHQNMNYNEEPQQASSHIPVY